MNLFAPVLDLLFPSFCLYCGELVEKRRLLCPICALSIDLMSSSGRCRRCFNKRHKKCKRCQLDPPLFDQAGAIFEDGFKEELWLKDPDLFAKTIGALFVIQASFLFQTSFDDVLSEDSLEAVAKEVKRFFGLKTPFFKKKEVKEEKILFLGRSLRNEENIPFIPTAKIFFLAFSL